jgi:hypothetical protein
MSEVQSPLKQVQEKFETKEKLVDEVVSLLKPPRGEREVLRERLRTQSNAKILRMHRLAQEIKEQFGDQQKLVEQIAALMGHPNDEIRLSALLEKGPGELLDLHRRWKTKGAARKRRKSKKKKKKSA